MAERQFEPDPWAAAEVRRFIRDTLPHSPILDDVVLVASELASNVIRHARTEFSVRVTGEDPGVRLEVSDGSSIVPAVEDLAESSRGLRMIEAVSEAWGIEVTGTGKSIWVELAVPTA